MNAWTPPTPDAETVAELIDDATDDVLAQDAARSDGPRERLERLVIQRPALTLGVAVGIGFILARLLPR